MKWSEIKDDKFWVIPAERMKMRKSHVVPLLIPVLDILKELELETGEYEYIFTFPINCRSVISENTFLFMLYSLGYKGPMTGRWFRSLASTALSQLSSFLKNIIERQLAYKESDAVRADYNTHT